MEQYTIYCTPEQAKKALELGAPIEVTFESSEHREPLLSFDNREYICPTAEQMFGWLESNGIDMIEVTCVNGMVVSDWSSVVYPFGAIEYQRYIDIIENNGFKNRKDATLDAIDSALDYLDNKNHK